MATTVALTGTCLTVAAAGPSVMPLAPPTPLVAMVTVAAPDDTMTGFVLEVFVQIETDWPVFWGITPRFGTIRIVVPALESDEVTVENVRVLGSAIVTVKAGMRRMAVSQEVFSSGWTFTRVAGALAASFSVVADVAVLEAEGKVCGWDTCNVAEMLLLPELVTLLSMSGVSFTVAIGDLVRVAIMSGVMRSTVWPLASVVIDEEGKRSTSFPWIRRLVAVRGIPAPLWVFTPKWPVIATWLKQKWEI